MSKYELREGGVFDNDNSIFIPEAPGNLDWEEYLEWVAIGNTPDPLPAPPNDPPSQCSMRQARLALLSAGHLQAVTDAITAIVGAEGDAALVEWEFGTVVMRTHPLVTSILPGLGLTETDIDNLFIDAITY